MTRRQKRVLDAIKGHIDTHGYSPTMHEIADVVGVSHEIARREHAALEAQGIIESAKAGKRHLPRSTRIV